MIPRLNFHHLFYFYTAATLGSVSKAARELRVSQPALSAQIKQLEQVLNLRLFERQGRRLVLTESGQHALAYAKAIFDTGREFMDSLHDRSGAGRLKVQMGVTDSVPKAAAAAFLTFLYRQNKDVHVALVEGTLPSMGAALKNHALDFLLSDVPLHAGEEERVRNHLIAKTPVAFYASPDLARRYRGFPDSLHGAPLILPAPQSQIYQSVQEFFTSCRVTPRIIAEIQDAELVYRMAAAGEGIAPLNTYAVEQNVCGKRLVCLGGGRRGAPIHDPLYLIYKDRIRAHPLQDKILSAFRLNQKN